MGLTEKRYGAAREATALMTPSDIDDTLNMLGCAPAVRDEIVERLVRLEDMQRALGDVVTTWRNGDALGGHEAIGRAEDLLKSVAE